MPMIRVDDEVYEYLNEHGRTEDSFNDVIRRELGLPKKGQTKKRSPLEVDERPTTATSGTLHKRIEGVLDLLLPTHWRSTPQRHRQILEVAVAFLRTPAEWSIKERHLHAARKVAATHGIEITTVHDKCGRQLYGTGAGEQMERFRVALDRLEKEMGGGAHERKPSGR